MWGAAGGEGPGKVGGARVWGPGLLSQTQASLCGLGSTESWEALACVCGRNKGDRSWAAAGGGGGNKGAAESGSQWTWGVTLGRACDLVGRAVSLWALSPEEGNRETGASALGGAPPPGNLRGGGARGRGVVSCPGPALLSLTSAPRRCWPRTTGGSQQLVPSPRLASCPPSACSPPRSPSPHPGP